MKILKSWSEVLVSRGSVAPCDNTGACCCSSDSVLPHLISVASVACISCMGSLASIILVVYQWNISFQWKF